MKAVEKTLRICCEENISMPFLASRQKEVQDIMVTLFNQECVTEIHEYNLVKDAKREGRIETAKSLMDALNLSVEQVFDFEQFDPPILNENILRRELEKRAERRRTVLLTIAGALFQGRSLSC